MKEKKIISKNPYDDIPIKLNTINFIELVEKKLADEENKNNKLNNKNKNYIRKIISKVKNDRKKIKKEEKTNTYRETINKIQENTDKKRKNNNIANYSFDKDETKMIIPENKNTKK